MKLKLILSIAFTLFTTSIVQAKTLDELKAALKVDGKPLILSYTIESNSAYIQMNPSIWNILPESGKQQAGDNFAATNFVKDMGLLNAWFRVDSTDVGHVAPGLSGYHWVPAN